MIPSMEAGEVMISDDGLVTITLGGSSPVIILRGIRVDVREVTGEITAAVLGDGTKCHRRRNRHGHFLDQSGLGC